MNVVAVMGSPHKGNTLALTQRFETELKRLGDVDFEYIHLRKADLRPCQGCFQCFIQGESNCPLRDDHDAIARHLEEADGVVFVSPVYSMHVSYLFKRFVDRFAYTFHRPRYFGKYAVVLAATGGIGLEDTLKYMKGVASGWGLEVTDALEYIAPPRNTPMKAMLQKKDRTRPAAEKFYRAMKEKKPRKLKFEDHFHYKAMREVYARLETMSPADYTYWKEKGWLKRDRIYFSDHIRYNPVHAWIVNIAAWFMARGIDKQAPKT
jgi:multimeric flavodoxin WrbA